MSSVNIPTAQLEDWVSERLSDLPRVMLSKWSMRASHTSLSNCRNRVGHHHGRRLEARRMCFGQCMCVCVCVCVCVCGMHVCVWVCSLVCTCIEKVVVENTEQIQMARICSPAILFRGCYLRQVTYAFLRLNCILCTLGTIVPHLLAWECFERWCVSSYVNAGYLCY